MEYLLKLCRTMDLNLRNAKATVIIGRLEKERKAPERLIVNLLNVTICG